MHLARILGIGLVALLGAVPTLAAGSATQVAPTPSAPTVRPGPPGAQRLVEDAVASLSKIRSLHAKADLVISGHRASLEGDFGVGDARFTLQRIDGKTARYIVVGGDKSWVSFDDGATWQDDTDQFGRALFAIVAAPLNPTGGLEKQGQYSVVGRETVEGLATTHVRSNTESPIDLWIADVPGLGSVIRKVRLIASGTDGEAEMTAVYSAFNEPFVVEPPTSR